MDNSGAKFKFIGHSTEIIRQSKNKGTLILKATQIWKLMQKYTFIQRKAMQTFTLCRISKLEYQNDSGLQIRPLLLQIP